MPGGYGGGAIPVPISNTEVKPSCADDTTAQSGGKVGRRQAFFILNVFFILFHILFIIISTLETSTFYAIIKFASNKQYGKRQH